MNELEKTEGTGGTGETDRESVSAAEPESAAGAETEGSPDQAADPESGGAAGGRPEEEEGAEQEVQSSPKEEPGAEAPAKSGGEDRAEAAETTPAEGEPEPAAEEQPPEGKPAQAVTEEAAEVAPAAEEETAETPQEVKEEAPAEGEPEPIAEVQPPEEKPVQPVTEEAAEAAPAAEEETAEMPAAEEAKKEEAPVEAEPEPVAEEQPPEEKLAEALRQEVAETAPAPREEAAAAPTAETEKEEAPAEAPKTAGVPGIDWYIIHTYSGFENKVKESLRTRAEAFGFSDRIGEILIPTEDVVEMKSGKKVTSKRLLYPGYVLVQLKMDDELWHVVKNTPRVTGFVGSGPTPTPLTADEVNQILFRQTASAEKPRPKLTFERNDRVRIIDGPFTNFTGTVEEVHPERNMLRVMVTIFGRETPVELEHFQVEKERI